MAVDIASMTALLPAAVEHRLHTYRMLLGEALAIPTIGLYLVGSLALCDFHDGVSDIDVVALLPRPPGPEAIARLRQIHAVLAQQAGGPSVDGLYLCPEHLRSSPAVPAIVPYSLDGVLVADNPCQEFGPVTWRCLARNGLTVSGPAPSALGIADDPDLLRASQIKNLDTYWTAWIARCEADLAVKPASNDANALALAWGVLGVCRIACTLETGRIVSKSQAGLWALTRMEPVWHPVIRDALSARTGAVTRLPLDRIGPGLALMRLVIAEARGYQALDPASPAGYP